ncbi:hypothetical protein HPC49_07515 [Pyxidicoccus fallax]|uniref:Lipoprotein n=1 Tax=Pyxidicoccus fallax TaxID=394095 RepID=A0A848L960_9BACT|nr:hypothetical protein [Pyxidicoccus fallax]NMO15540.1 hypothetical protein [Pyxidicoccus fallax]NPC78100.1 hypothetical protein [Pyxidicoccus fallax]
MKRWSVVMAAVALCAGCEGNKKEDRPTRAQLRRTGPATVEVVPTDGQLPYCMLYTVSEKGVIRQLTLTRENRSIRCDPKKPVANTSFRIPVQEGKVRMYIFFSDDRIPAGPVAQQLYDLRGQDRINAMDLRLPGRVFVETLEFTPEESSPPVTGGVVGAGGELVDGGTSGGANGNGNAAPGTGVPVLADGGTLGGPAATEEAP